jgi:hypothetical protein
MTNAVLLRDVPLVVRDVGSGGCLIESSAPLHVGTIGWLEVEFEGERRFEWFRIARVHAARGHVFVAGVEFLPLAAAGADSFRSAIGRLRRSRSGTKKPRKAGNSPDRNSESEIGGPITQPSQAPTGSPRKILSFFRRRS